MLELSYHVSPQLSLIHLTPMSDQDIISPYNVNANIKQVSDENEEIIN